MIKTEIEIINKLGLHARAASKLVSTTAAFGCKIEAGRDGRLVDGKSIMSVMMLAASKGTVLDFVFDGDDEKENEIELVESQQVQPDPPSIVPPTIADTGMKVVCCKYSLVNLYCTI